MDKIQKFTKHYFLNTLGKSLWIYTGQYTFPIQLLNDDNMLGEHKGRKKYIVYGRLFDVLRPRYLSSYSREIVNVIGTRVLYKMKCLYLWPCDVCTMLSWQMLGDNWPLVVKCSFSYVLPRYIYIRYGKHLLLTLCHVCYGFISLFQKIHILYFDGPKSWILRTMGHVMNIFIKWNFRSASNKDIYLQKKIKIDAVVQKYHVVVQYC